MRKGQGQGGGQEGWCGGMGPSWAQTPASRVVSILRSIIRRNPCNAGGLCARDFAPGTMVSAVLGVTVCEAQGIRVKFGDAISVELIFGGQGVLASAGVTGRLGRWNGRGHPPPPMWNTALSVLFGTANFVVQSGKSGPFCVGSQGKTCWCTQ